MIVRRILVKMPNTPPNTFPAKTARPARLSVAPETAELAKTASPARTAGPAKPPKRPMAVLAKQEAGSQEAGPGPTKLSKGLVKLLDFI